MIAQVELTNEPGKGSLHLRHRSRYIITTVTMSSDNFTCPVLDQNLTVTQAVAFDNTDWIVSGHNRVPRFGHSNNITSAITGSNADVRNYVIGLSAASIALFAFFILWFLILIVLKMLGYNLVGFCSG